MSTGLKEWSACCLVSCSDPGWTRDREGKSIRVWTDFHGGHWKKRKHRRRQSRRSIVDWKRKTTWMAADEGCADSGANAV